jgi:hypothetical protein
VKKRRSHYQHYHYYYSLLSHQERVRRMNLVEEELEVLMSLIDRQ